jgi:hypothetical protein
MLSPLRAMAILAIVMLFLGVACGGDESESDAPMVVRHLFVVNSGQIAPDLAEAWEVSADGLVLSIKLVSGQVLAKGRPFDSQSAAVTVQAQRSVFDPTGEVKVMAADAQRLIVSSSAGITQSFLMALAQVEFSVQSP